jgi:chromate transporter
MSVDTILKLIELFAKLSLLGFGGGKGIFPEMRAAVVTQYHWLTPAQFAEYYTIGRLVPGPTTIMSVLVGFSVGKLPGAVVAALAIFVPSSIVMFLVVRLWQRAKDSPIRDALGHGLAPAIVGLSWASAWVIGKGVIGSWPSIALAAVVVFLSLRTKIPTVALILGAGVAGAFFL